ncbi:MAG: hypothetical protein ACFUZC_15870 [Chthoniobacteraceae bacterium]
MTTAPILSATLRPALLCALLTAAALPAQAEPAAPSPASQNVEIAFAPRSTPGGIFVFTQGPGQAVDAWAVSAPQTLPLYYKFQISDQHDKLWHTAEGAFSTDKMLSLGFDSSRWPLGPYDAKLEVFASREAATPLYSRTAHLGIVTTTKLGKARPGEFLYGLDPANSYIYRNQTPTAFAYYRLMGVDILRIPYNKGMPETPEGIREALAGLTPEDLQTGLIVDPPKDSDPAKRAAQLAKKEQFLEHVGQTYAGSGPGKVHFFELGNEPDLPRFYPGPISDYIQSYTAMRNAIKRGTLATGLPDDATVVMNGGLCFANKEGPARAREILTTVDRSALDAIAYHGHGPGIESERSAYERVRDTASQVGKTGLPFVETESGYCGIDRNGAQIQARTVVQKMTYGQSIGLPVFYFFRLFMEGHREEGGYGMTEAFIEPRPSVLSYRNLVERLRHRVFVKSVELSSENKTSKVDAYLFAEQDAEGHPTGNKTLVAFTEIQTPCTLRLRLDEQGTPVHTPTQYDLYGNATPVSVEGYDLSLPLGLDPVYLTWNSQGPLTSVKELPPILSVRPVPMVAGADNHFSITVQNPSEEALDATITVEPRLRIATVEPVIRIEQKLPVGQPLKVPLNVRLKTSNDVLRLPIWWKIFLDADFAKCTPDQLCAIPENLPSARGEAPQTAGRYVWAWGNRLNFDKLAGGFGLKRTALAYTYIDAPRDMELNCGASADWFMAWFVNGVKVCDTLETGNGQHGTIADHPFRLPLKKGRNVLCAVVGSGNGGWSLAYGGPKEWAVAATNNDPDSLTVTLTANGKVLARESAPVQLREPVPSLGAPGVPANFSGWQTLEPLVVFDTGSVKNPWLKEPEQWRWYGGKKDLSATAWLRESGDTLHLFVAVTDDKLSQAPEPSKLAAYDSLRVVLANAGGQPIADVTAGLIGDKPASIGTEANVEIERQEGPDGATYYHIAFPKFVVGQEAFRLNFTIADSDADYLKQTLSYGSVDAPVQGQRFILP